jgi:methyl-accepting chemotaxis protein
MMSSILKGLFTPATKLMGQLWYWQKFVLLTLLFTIPVGFALFSYITQIDKSIAVTAKEIIGLQYISPVTTLLQDLQQHRGMASLYLRGDGSFLPRLVEKEKKIREDLVLMSSKDHEFGKELGTVNTLNVLQKKWEFLESNYMRLAPKESFRQHTEFIADILALISLVSDTSNLILDSDIDSYYLMNTIVNTLPNLSENLGQARAFVLSIRDPKKVSDAERRDIINYSKIALIADEKIKRDIHVAFEQNNSLEAALDGPLEETSVSVRSFSSLLDTFVNTSKVETPLPEYYTFSTTVINTNFSLLQSISASLDTLLRRRIDGLRVERQNIIYITIFSYILILYVFTGFYLLVVRTVRTLEDIAKQLISGRVTEVSVLSNDELGEVGKSFNAIGQELIASNNEILAKAQELQKQSDELERFNKLMVGRELKMVELKEEMRAIQLENDTLKRSVAG